jgi:hypothetical protein
MKTSDIVEQTARPVRAWHANDRIHVALENNHELSFPVHLSKRLESATASQRSHIELLPFSLHWPEVDEDISIESIERGEFV